MTIELDVTCDCCQTTITSDGETYCACCWNDTIKALPHVEEELHKLAKSLTGEPARACERLATHIYDLNFEERR